MKKLILFLLIFSTLLSPLAFADDVWQKAKSPEYGQKTVGMLGRGVVNVATCFMDIIVQTVEGTQDGPPFVGTMTGLGGGLGCTALRVTSGALDVLTFWVPDFNGIPVSRSYSNCLEEEDLSGSESPAVAAQAPSPVQRQAEDYVKK